MPAAAASLPVSEYALASGSVPLAALFRLVRGTAGLCALGGGACAAVLAASSARCEQVQQRADGL